MLGSEGRDASAERLAPDVDDAQLKPRVMTSEKYQA